MSGLTEPHQIYDNQSLMSQFKRKIVLMTKVYSLQFWYYFSKHFFTQKNVRNIHLSKQNLRVMISGIFKYYYCKNLFNMDIDYKKSDRD